MHRMSSASCLPFNHTLSNPEAQCFKLWEAILLQQITVNYDFNNCNKTGTLLFSFAKNDEKKLLRMWLVLKSCVTISSNGRITSLVLDLFLTHLRKIYSYLDPDMTFLRASAMLKHVIAIGLTSVRPSVTRCYCIKTAEHIVMLSSPHDSPFILVLCVSKIFEKFRRGHLLRGRQTEVGYDKTGDISETRCVDQSIDTTCYQLSATVDCDQHTRDRGPCIYR